MQRHASARVTMGRRGNSSLMTQSIVGSTSCSVRVKRHPYPPQERHGRQSRKIYMRTTPYIREDDFVDNEFIGCEPEEDKCGVWADCVIRHAHSDTGTTTPTTTGVAQYATTIRKSYTGQLRRPYPPDQTPMPSTSQGSSAPRAWVRHTWPLTLGGAAATGYGADIETHA